ncbi:autotransporter outer membrane beta-barrel domain-containing protein [Bartonella sp. AU55XJBT]|uniref:autotransporter family protein n=1 Tax=Bartonella sp. AU55XJBT TaxID=3019091 RepID=UPI0023613156|nr:autotransporter outer membrane beta-barrel domain-containing protein [Bartonella sp. AU55XJBT]
MAGLFKNRFSLCTFTTALIFLTHHVDVFAHNAESKILPGEKQDLCNQNAAFYQCSDGKQHEINNKVYSLTGQKVNGNHGAIEASKERTFIHGKNITVKGILDQKSNSEKNFWKYGVKVSEKAYVSLSESTLSGVLVGVESQGYGIAISGGSIDAIEVGAFAEGKSHSKLYLTNTQVNFGTVGVKAGENGYLILEGVSMNCKGNSDKVGQGRNTEHQSDHAAFHISGNGYVQFVKGSVDVSDVHGLLLQKKGDHADDTHANIEDSNITVKGNALYGMYFKNMTTLADLFNGGSPHVKVRKTAFKVPYSTAIYSNKSRGSIKFSEKSEISGDLLLKAEGGSLVKILANDSMLVGGVHVDENSSAEFKLRGSSKWTLSRPKNKTLQVSDSIGVSSVSLIELIDSSIIFEKPADNTMNDYQTLRIGKGEGVVYKAQGDAHIYLNTYLNKGGDIKNQKTDRLLIHGDIKGKTIIHVQSVSGSPGGGTGLHGNDKGISIIQVSGKAGEGSFQLEGGYVTLEDGPYQYKLYAYGPAFHLGRANASLNASVSQRLVEGEGDFWDFRLENGYIDSDTTSKPTQNSKLVSASRPNQGDKAVVPMSSADSLSKIEDVSSSRRGVRSVVPQVPTYLLLPNSLLQAGLMDISNQNKQLETQRANPRGMLEIRENPASFLRGYGGSSRYTSDLSALEYGYGGDLGYYALEAGVLLQKIESVENVISFGVMGSYGKLSLQPLNVEQSQKSTFDKWTATVYGSLQHDTGFYVDGLASYGFFKGDVVTTARGKTATLKGNPLSLSLMSGRKVATGYEGVVFDPQAQVVYQYLQFNEARDIDHFTIEMDKLDQWMVRVGGRLLKILVAPEKDRDVSFYGRIHFAHDFGKERSVRFKDSFQLGAFGSSLEAGLGLNARLSQNFTFHGDLVYQHKLSKGGFSGISFSGGLRYRF